MLEQRRMPLSDVHEEPRKGKRLALREKARDPRPMLTPCSICSYSQRSSAMSAQWTIVPLEPASRDATGTRVDRPANSAVAHRR